jgi:hypothetical protein
MNRHLNFATLAVFLSVCGGDLVVSNAHAADAITVEEYGELKEARDLSILVPYLQGAADAMWSANAALTGKGKPPLYCATGDKPLSATQLMELANHLLTALSKQGRPVSGSVSITTVAANAVVFAFPCRS